MGSKNARPSPNSLAFLSIWSKSVKILFLLKESTIYCIEIFFFYPNSLPNVCTGFGTGNASDPTKKYSSDIISKVGKPQGFEYPIFWLETKANIIESTH